MTDDCREWLRALKLEIYADDFAENGVDLRALPYLTEQDLKDLGVLLGHRRVLLAAIEKLNQEQAAPTDPQSSPDGKTTVLGERRQITALFADISGFTELTGRADAEEVHLLLNRFFSVVDSVVSEYGGTIDKHIGDAVMAIFGAPIAHKDDPERALRAALEIHGRVARLEPPLQVHVGIASGQVVASRTGSATHSEYTVTGDSVNLASRLTDLAGPGETLVSDALRQSVGVRFAGENLGEVKVEGIDEAVTLWRLEDLTVEPTEYDHAFVGRERELSQLAAVLGHCLATGKGETVIIRGEAGIGKTRLVREFGALAAAQGFDLHTGLVLDFGTGEGQDAVRTLLRSLLRIGPASDQPARDHKAKQVVAAGVAARHPTRLPERSARLAPTART